MPESACLVIIVLLLPHFTVIYLLSLQNLILTKNGNGGDLKRNTFPIYKYKSLVMRRVKDLEELQDEGEIPSASLSLWVPFNTKKRWKQYWIV